MTSFHSTRKCFAKSDASDKRPGPNHRLDPGRTLLIVTLAAFQLFARSSAALPVVLFAGQQTDRFGPHSFPGWTPVGDKVQVFAAIDSSDPIASPTISAQAVQGGTTLTLDPIPSDPVFEGWPFHLRRKFIDFDPSLTGPWEITPTDSTGTGLSTFGDALIEPEFLPLVEDVIVQGTPLGAQVAWTLPNLDGFDVDTVTVSVIEAASGRHMWGSDLLPVQSTSFVPPADVLNVGVDYVYGVILGDIEGPRYENLSWAFSAPFRFTNLNGDFNLDGTVDAADYVTWRNGLGTLYSPSHYDIWRANFGSSLGPGSGAALPSAAPLSAAVPEPSAIALAAVALVPFLFRRARPSHRGWPKRDY
jgi:hypothetical protein